MIFYDSYIDLQASSIFPDIEADNTKTAFPCLLIFYDFDKPAIICLHKPHYIDFFQEFFS